jgi:hypothetical protein
MNASLSNENFGLVIAYILPGFVALWGVSYFSPTVESWITASQQGAPSVADYPPFCCGLLVEPDSGQAAEIHGALSLESGIFGLPLLIFLILML